MAVTILTPLNGDTVSPTFSIVSDFNVSQGCSIDSEISGTTYFGDNSTSISTASADVNSAAISNLATQTDVCKATVSTDPDQGSDSQDNVTVTAGGGPNPISTTPPVQVPPPPPGPYPKILTLLIRLFELFSSPSATTKKTFKVNGKCDPATGPLFVNCVAYRVDPNPSPPPNGLFTAVATGSAVPDSKTGAWSVLFTLDCDCKSLCRHIARASAFDSKLNLIATQTQVIPNCR
jgi:hypothetical protein